MSPEMLNEKEYNNKTDVYSYGIVLFVLFTGRLPKQSIREKLDKVPLKFPKVSSKISQYCINLIKKCTFFDPKKRPTFEKIIIDMEKNSFLLASEIDTKAIMNRYKELNRFDSCQNHMKKKPKK